MTVTQATPRVRSRRVSVPRRVRTLATLSLLSLALLLGVTAAGAAGTGEGLRTIGHDAGPQVLATTGLYRHMSSMDALVAESLLLGAEYGEQRQADHTAYDTQRQQVTRTLLKAYELALDNPAEQRTVQSLIEGLGRYERLAARARLLDAQSGHKAGETPEAVVAVYRQATDLMHRELLPQAYNLTLETGTIVRRAHAAEQSAAALAKAAVVLTGLLALGLLVALQLYLTRSFRRVFAPALVLATLLAGVGTVLGVTLLSRQDSALDEAKRRGFDQVLTLTRARAISNSMYGDQSRYLLDAGRRDTYEHTFLDKAQAVAYLKLDKTSLPAYQAALDPPDPKDQKGPRFLGMLAPVVGQDGERVFQAYQAFQKSDAELRKQPPAQAIQLWNSTLKEDYQRYDQLLEELTKRYESVFGRAIGSGDAALAGLWRFVPAGLALSALLILAGIWPRLKEYR
ncbi:hypothetical protein [Nonomuraea sp. NPDC050310]|uniref:hypothetical protein n=1 Tax=unclassified Nonomuraea TaxID=2593643 RepID=UPI0033FC1E3A